LLLVLLLRRRRQQQLECATLPLVYLSRSGFAGTLDPKINRKFIFISLRGSSMGRGMNSALLSLLPIEPSRAINYGSTVASWLP